MLDQMQKTISLAKFVRSAKHVTNEVESGAIYRIRSRRNRSVLLVDEERYEGWMAAFEFMQRPNWRAELDEAERDAVEGRLYDLSDVLREFGLEDTRHRKSAKADRKPARPRGAKRRKRASHTSRRAP